MGFIPQITCRHCGNKYMGIFNRCPHCGTRRVRPGGHAATSTTAASKGSAANARLNINTQWQFIFGCVLVIAVIAAVIILVTASLGGGEKIDIEGQITWSIDATDTMPESVTVNLSANGQTVDTATVTEDKNGEWVYSFEKLDMYDDDDKEIRYAVSAAPIEGKTVYTSGNDLVIATEVVVELPDPEPSPEPEPPVNPNIHTVIINFLGTDLKEEFTLFAGEPLDLDAIAYPVDEVCTVMWKSTDESIFTVDKDGVCTAVSNGWAKVVAYVGEVKHEINVRVVGFED